MPLLRRPAAPDPVVAERVGLLLARRVPPGGWLPPEEDEHDAGPVGGHDVTPSSRSWSPRPAEAAEHLAETEGGTSAVPSSWSRRPSKAGAGLLPSTLAGGRLDPGRRGAVALLLVCLLAAVVAAAVVLHGRPQEVAVPAVAQVGAPLPGTVEPTTAPSAVPTELVVAVVGEVAAPGVVRLPTGARVDDAVRAAGGLAPGGSAGMLNLARPLVDGEQVVVGPDAPPDAPAASGGAPAGGLVDLNRASAAELDGLPGIGPVLAERIVAWRTENGGFASVDQLREVPGIGEAKYSSLKAEVTV